MSASRLPPLRLAGRAGAQRDAASSRTSVALTAAVVALFVLLLGAEIGGLSAPSSPSGHRPGHAAAQPAATPEMDERPGHLRSDPPTTKRHGDRTDRDAAGMAPMEPLKTTKGDDPHQHDDDGGNDVDHASGGHGGDAAAAAGGGGHHHVAAASRCTSGDWSKGALLVGNRPVGTYLCEYFPKAKPVAGGCRLTCPADQVSYVYSDAPAEGFPCTILQKASPEQLKTADIVVNHHGPIPKRHRPEQITLFYSGESNVSEGKKAKPEYQQSYAEVVSFHRWRRFHFTWTHRFAADFTAIASGEKRFPQPKLDAIVVFVSRCKKGGRDAIIRALANAYTVHSFGGCVRTHRVNEVHPECVDGKSRYKEKLCVFSKYRFALTLDNSREDDYVTEKVYHALVAGPIPIYDGAPNVDEFLPSPQSIIRIAEFQKPGSSGAEFRKDPKVLDMDKLVGKLNSVAKQGADALELQWRKAPSAWPDAFHENLAHPEPTCGLCALAVGLKCDAREKPQRGGGGEEEVA